MIALPNIVAGEFVVPEYIQNDCDPETLAEKTIELLSSGEIRDRMISLSANNPDEFYSTTEAWIKASRKFLSDNGFTEDQEARISKVMKANPQSSREQVINKMKEQGKL